MILNLNQEYEFSLHVYFTAGSADLLGFLQKWFWNLRLLVLCEVNFLNFFFIEEIFYLLYLINLSVFSV